MDFLAGFSAVSGRFPPFSAHDEKGLPIRPKKTSRISAARNSFFRAAARIYMTPVWILLLIKQTA